MIAKTGSTAPVDWSKRTVTPLSFPQQLTVAWTYLPSPLRDWDPVFRRAPLTRSSELQTGTSP